MKHFFKVIFSKQLFYYVKRVTTRLNGLKRAMGKKYCGLYYFDFCDNLNYTDMRIMLLISGGAVLDFYWILTCDIQLVRTASEKE